MDHPNENAQKMNVSPKMAEEWLGRNTFNRNIRRGKVLRLASDMLNGDWEYTGESIKFDTAGKLMDGQHRLLAIMESGVTITTLVVTGLKPESMLVLDQVTPRSTADALHLSGVTQATKVAAVLKLINSKGDSTQSTLTNAQALELLESYPEVVEITRVVGGMDLKKLAPPATLGYAYWLIARVNPQGGPEFFERWNNMNDLPSGSPILALNKRALNSEWRGTSSYRSIRDAIACIVTAWNMYATDKAAQVIRPARNQYGVTQVPDVVKAK
jgi:hypothetical protein